MAVPARLELATFGLGNRCSIRLSYGTNSTAYAGLHPGSALYSIREPVGTSVLMGCTPPEVLCRSRFAALVPSGTLVRSLRSVGGKDVASIDH
jgi:hypothetical protein